MTRRLEFQDSKDLDHPTVVFEIFSRFGRFDAWILMTFKILRSRRIDFYDFKDFEDPTCCFAKILKILTNRQIDVNDFIDFDNGTF